MRAGALLAFMRELRDRPELRFDMLIDVCGVDYSAYGEGAWEGARFAAVYHLLSLPHNRRLRVRAFAADDDFPVLPSVIDVWPCANWFEREAFDLYGIVFDGHPDLRRLLTDYGFVGHPFRKDFPRLGLCRDALRPRAGTRHLPAGHDRAARDHAARDPGRELRRYEMSAFVAEYVPHDDERSPLASLA